MNIKSAFVTTALGIVMASGIAEAQEKNKIQVDCNPSGVTGVTHVTGNTAMVARFNFKGNNPVDEMDISVDNKIVAKSVDASTYFFENGNSVAMSKKESSVVNKYREELYQISVAVCPENKAKTVEKAPSDKLLESVVKVLDLL